MNSLEGYIKKMRTSIDEKVFSPLFIRLANLYYLNDNFDECINICTIGIQIYPGYLTPKIILLKALLKLEYINEAENLLSELEFKVQNEDLLNKYREILTELKKKPQQERIFYSDKISPVIEFKSYAKKIEEINPSSSLYMIEDLYDFENINVSEEDFQEFKKKYEDFKFDVSFISKEPSNNTVLKQKEAENNSLLNKIKISTETIADIFAKQGFYNEAYTIYSELIKKDITNKQIIQEKINALDLNYR